MPKRVPSGHGIVGIVHPVAVARAVRPGTSHEPVRVIMIMAAAVEPDGSVGHSWGKARTVRVASVQAGRITDWQDHEVGWDLLHDEGAHGAHHARVVSFLRTHGVQAVLVDHVGDGMRRMLGSMGVHLQEDVHGDAHAAMLAAEVVGTIPPGGSARPRQ